MCLEDSGSTYYTSFGFEVLIFIELALYFMKKQGPFQLLLSLPCSVISVSSRSRLCLIWLCSIQPVSSSTPSPCGPFDHNTIIRWLYFFSFRHHPDPLHVEGHIGLTPLDPPIVGTSFGPMVLLIRVITIGCRSTTSTTNTGPLCLRVQHLVLDVRACRRTHVLILY